MAEQLMGANGRNLVDVNENARMKVSAVSVDENIQATKLGDSYNINTGRITLTNDTQTPVIYLKNNETQDLHITAIALGIGPTTGGGSELTEITVIRNPTAGTIISSPTNVDINSNRNYASSKTLTADVYKGATGDTMTDGVDHLFFFQGTGRLYAAIDEIVPKGSTIGVKILPPSGNTSQRVYVAIICHVEDPKDE